MSEEQITLLFMQIDNVLSALKHSLLEASGDIDSGTLSASDGGASGEVSWPAPAYHNKPTLALYLKIEASIPIKEEAS